MGLQTQNLELHNRTISSFDPYHVAGSEVAEVVEDGRTALRVDMTRDYRRANLAGFLPLGEPPSLGEVLGHLERSIGVQPERDDRGRDPDRRPTPSRKADDRNSCDRAGRADPAARMGGAIEVRRLGVVGTLLERRLGELGVKSSVPVW